MLTTNPIYPEGFFRWCPVCDERQMHIELRGGGWKCARCDLLDQVTKLQEAPKAHDIVVESWKLTEPADLLEGKYETDVNDITEGLEVSKQHRPKQYHLEAWLWTALISINGRRSTLTWPSYCDFEEDAKVEAESAFNCSVIYVKGKEALYTCCDKEEK